MIRYFVFEFFLYREKLGNEYFLHEEIKISFFFITMYFVVSILAHWRLTTQQTLSYCTSVTVLRIT